MQSTQTPTLIPLAFAANGTKNTIPEASQIGIVNGAASLNDGFPPLTMTPIAAGGVPPSGADMNGILFLATSAIRWMHAGGLYAFSSSFAGDSNVGGYPNGAELMSADLQGTWISLNDNNTDNPDTGAGTKWVPGRAYGVTAIGGLTNANVTLTPAQAAKNKITLAGTLTGNIQIIFPTWLRNWDIVNNTTGIFTVTCKTASGTGVTVAQGGVLSRIAGDGTNLVQLNEQMNVAAATTSTNPVQLGQVQTQTGTAFTTAGTAPNYTLTPSPAINAYATSQRFSVTFNAAGTTGSNTLNISGLGAKNLKQYDSNGAKQPAVIPASGWSSDVVYDGTDLVVLDPVIQSSSVVGVARNVSINMSAAGTSMTITADEIVAKTALGGMPYINVNVNDTINSATTGAGGMDTGSAPTNGYVAIYRIYNPTTNTWKWLGWNATSAIAPNIYGGANMPSGYTASALVSVWPTNGSGQFVVGYQVDRAVYLAVNQALNTSTQQSSVTALSIASLVPRNAKTVKGEVYGAPSTSGASVSVLVSGSSNRLAEQGLNYAAASTTAANTASYNDVPLVTQQTIYYIGSVTAGTLSYIIYVSGYSF